MKNKKIIIFLISIMVVALPVFAQDSATSTLPDTVNYFWQSFSDFATQSGWGIILLIIIVIGVLLT